MFQSGWCVGLVHYEHAREFLVSTKYTHKPEPEFQVSTGLGYVHPLPVGHPLVLLLVLHDPDDDRVRDGAAEVGGGDGVEALVPGDVVLEEHGVDVGRVVVGLDAEVLAVRVVVLVPDHLRKQGESG